MGAEGSMTPMPRLRTTFLVLFAHNIYFFSKNFSITLLSICVCLSSCTVYHLKLLKLQKENIAHI